MTIPSTPRKAGPLLGDDVQTAWPFTFKVFAETDVQVTIADADGIETVLTSNYSVELNANQETSPGGTVTYPVTGTELPTGSALSITGALDYDQPLDLPSGGNFSPLALENQLDRTTMQIQQLAEEVGRAARLPVTSAEDADALVADLVRIADSADNLDTVAGAITNVNTVATDIADVNTVATSIADVNAVGGGIADVSAVAAIAADVSAVADSVADVTNFADVYQGAHAADPALRNNGGALQSGDLYFNTTENALRAYSGTIWVSGTAGSVSVQTFSGDGIETEFTLTTAPSSENNAQVYISGVYQQKSQFSITDVTLTFGAAPPAGTNNIEVVTLSSLALGETDAALVSFTPAGSIEATDVQAALVELDGDLIALVAALGTAAGLDAGTDPLELVQLDVAGKLPAVSAENLTSVPLPGAGTVTPTMLTQKLTLATAVAASGTAVDFTGLPSWVKRITVMFDGLSTNGTSQLLIRLGGASGIDATNYRSTAVTSAGTSTNNTTGLLIQQATIAANLVDSVTDLRNPTGNVWLSSVLTQNGIGTMMDGAGRCALTEALTQLRITTVNGTDTFDAGTINILYEG